MSLEAWGDENPDDADYYSWSERAMEAGWIDPADYSPGVIAILQERERQETEEGWTPEHDDQHTDETLALVAALYATPFRLFSQESSEDHVLFEDPWPSEWDDEWDKRDQLDRRRKLVIAGALIAAEIDRLDRASKRDSTS
tara:strand:- start:7211 stop:7633 length:423 start_codon:yes stop_codon:yes gene_type:complete